MTINAPKFLDLDWKGGFTAHPTSTWWTVYRAHKPYLRTLGFTAVQDGANWVVQFDPTGVDANVLEHIRVLDLDFTDAVAAAADRAKRQAEYDEIVRQREEARAAERKARHLEAVKDAQQRGLAILQRWGMAAVQKAKIAELVAADDLDNGDLKDLDRYIRETERKNISRVREAALRDKPAVDWPEDTVVRAVRFMTGRDADHAELANLSGWGAGDSSWGHWCVAMLDTEHHAMAVKIGRQLCANYVDTQLKDFAA